MQQAIDSAYALHHPGYANNLAKFGTIVGPAGAAVLRGAR
jgi:hypothetical protein